MAASGEGLLIRHRQAVIAWRCARFDDLTPREAHDAFQLRSAVFVVEQNCVFPDLDGRDPECWHLLGYEKGKLVAYARLLPPGVKYEEPSIGRVVTSLEARRIGAGRSLMREALGHTDRLWAGKPLRIGAQMYLERFYGDFGFVKVSDPYDEDGILHIDMIRKPPSPLGEGRGEGKPR